MSFKKQTDLNVFTFCTILKKHRLKGGSRLHQHLLCSIVLVTTIWVHIIGVDNSKPIYKTEFSPFSLSVLFLDGLGKGIHCWFWGDSSPVLKNLKFLWIPLALLRLFIFPQIQNKYFSRVYSKFALSLVEAFAYSEWWMGRDSHGWYKFKNISHLYLISFSRGWDEDLSRTWLWIFSMEGRPVLL